MSICRLWNRMWKKAVIRDESRYQIGWIFGMVPNGSWPPTHTPQNEQEAPRYIFIQFQNVMQKMSRSFVPKELTENIKSPDFVSVWEEETQQDNFVLHEGFLHTIPYHNITYLLSSSQLKMWGFTTRWANCIEPRRLKETFDSICSFADKSNSILRHRSTMYWLRSKQVWVWTPVSCETNHNWFQMLSSLRILARANDDEKQRLFIEHSIKLKLLCIFGNDLIFTQCLWKSTLHSLHLAHSEPLEQPPG